MSCMILKPRTLIAENLNGVTTIKKYVVINIYTGICKYYFLLLYPFNLEEFYANSQIGIWFLWT